MTLPVVELEKRLRSLFEHELGREVREALADPQVLEVLLNPDGRVWVDRLKEGLRRLEFTMPPQAGESLLGAVAAFFGGAIHGGNPLLEAVLPYHGYRVTGVLRPIAAAPVFSIRKPAETIFRLETLVAHHPPATTAAASECRLPRRLSRVRLDDAALLQLLRRALLERWNIVISGGAGSGKTTVANALLAELAALLPDERIVVLEDTPELQVSLSNSIALTTTREVSLAALVRTTLRLRPDRIVVGEVRGREAHDLLKAWNTGHPGGIATLHANDASAALERLDQLVQEAGVPSQLRRIHETVDLVIHVVRRGVIAELVVIAPEAAPEPTHSEGGSNR